jgi:hypothetical protein
LFLLLLFGFSCKDNIALGFTEKENRRLEERSNRYWEDPDKWVMTAPPTKGPSAIPTTDEVPRGTLADRVVRAFSYI